MTVNPQFDAVAEFNTRFGHEVREMPSLDYPDVIKRHEFFEEEVEEIGTALSLYFEAQENLKYAESYEEEQGLAEDRDNAVVEFLDGLADTLVTLYGLAQATGMPITEAFDKVHKSNMTKLGADGKPVYHESGPKKGKIAKGPDFVPPTSDLRDLLGL